MQRLPQDEDQIVFLLCKQNNELFVLEVHLKDGERPKTITKHHLRLQSPLYGSRLIEFLGSNEFFDISDLCELQIDLDNDDFPSLDEYQEDFELDSSLNSRPVSASSISSFVSSKKSTSRPDSGSSQPSNISSADSFDSLMWETQFLNTDLPDTAVPGMMRPATAISLMRLPPGSRPMIIIPKTRPASAIKWIDGFKSHLKSSELLSDSTIANNADKIRKSPESVKKTPKSFADPLVMKNDQTVLEDYPSHDSLIKDESFKDNEYLEYFQSQSIRQSSSLTLARQKTAERKLKAPIQKPPKSPPKDQILEFNSTKCGPGSRKATPRKQIRTPQKSIPQKAHQRSCCSQCNKKLGPAQIFTCKCEKMFCSTHRYSDRHTCTYDFKTPAKAALAQQNPVVKNEKLVRL